MEVGPSISRRNGPDGRHVLLVRGEAHSVTIQGDAVGLTVEWGRPVWHGDDGEGLLESRVLVVPSLRARAIEAGVARVHSSSANGKAVVLSPVTEGFRPWETRSCVRGSLRMWFVSPVKADHPVQYE